MKFSLERPAGYTFGVVLFFVGGIIFLLGFACPYWTRLDRTEKLTSGDNLYVQNYYGLWLNCTQVAHDDADCSSTIGVSSPIWLKAVRIFQCLSLAGYVIIGCYLTVVMFITRRKHFNRIVENLMISSSLLGIVGAAIYAAELSRAHEVLRKLYAQMSSVDLDQDHVSWAFVLDILGCFISLFAGILVALFNHPAPDDDDKPESVSSSPPSNGVTKTANQPQRYTAPEPMAAGDIGGGQGSTNEAYSDETGAAERENDEQTLDTKM